MKYLPRFLVAAFSLYLSCIVSDSAIGQDLRFTSQEFSPFHFTEGGKFIGPVTELIQTICDEAKITCSMQSMPWERAQQDVKEGRANAIFVIARNAEREEWLDFSRPLLTSEYGFFSREKDSFKYVGPESLVGKTVGVYGPSNTSKTLDKIMKDVPKGDMKIDLRPDDESGFEKLARSRVDLVFSASDVGLDILKRRKIEGVKYAAKYSSLIYHIGFSKKHADKAVVEKFNAVLAKKYDSKQASDFFTKAGLTVAP